jgi:TonB family protein
LGRYFKYSLILHTVMITLLLLWSFAAARPAEKHMTFVILPKGNSMHSVMTKELVEAIKNPNLKPGAASSTPAKVTPTPAQTPEEQHSAINATPTPIKIETPPIVTPAPSAIPEKTIAVAPKGTPKPAESPKPTESPAPTHTPAPTASPSPEKTAIPKPKPSATPSSKKKAATQKTPNTKKTADAKSKAKPTPRKTPKIKKTPRVVASAYELANGSGENRFAGMNLPKKTPANASAEEAGPGDEVGVPGVAEGVEGAPLPLDRNQSMLSMLYTTRARMKIQTNFTVPPGVDDPSMTCSVEWEILPNGDIRNVRVAKSTGNPVYDSFAVDAIRKTGNLGPLPPEFGNRSIWTSLEFVYAGEPAPGATSE